MTRKLEEEFNLPPIEDVLPVEKKEESKEITEVEIKEALTNAEKIDSALPRVKDLETHDKEMEDIAQKAIDSYDELMNLGMNVQDAHAGRVFETASKMLQIAMDSKNAKVDKKLKMIDLQIRKMRLDQNEGTETSSDGGVMDRNHILQILNKKDK
jgi:RNase P/RNase MRP subunit p29